MAVRLNESVVRGEIDNREKGRVIGHIWVVGRVEPIELDLKGNAWPDLAGSLLTFTNPAPHPGDDTVNLRILQMGTTGDITASKKVRVFQVPVDEAFAMQKRGEQPPERLANSVHIEWFSTTNGRVVIESAAYQTAISEPTWRMTREEAERLPEANSRAMVDFMRDCGQSLVDEEDDGIELDEFETGERMNEYQWEKFMQESDRRTDRYSELFDKYASDPDRDLIVAREMGWKWLVEALEQEKAEKAGIADVDRPMSPADEDEDDVALEAMDLDLDEEKAEPQPDPYTEGSNWVRDDHGHPRHPLVLRTRKTTMDMWRYCKDAGLLDTEGRPGDDDIQDMIFQAQSTGAKMSGALHGLPYGNDDDPGFIIANLKRALARLHEALSLVEVVRSKGRIDEHRLTVFQQDLLDIRHATLLLMEEYRRRG